MNAGWTILAKQRLHFSFLTTKISLGISLDEAVSLMSTLLPYLKRWREVGENEQRYGAEIRESYGDEVVDVANEKYVTMCEATHLRADELELAI